MKTENILIQIGEPTMKINEKIPALNGSITDPRTRRYLAPQARGADRG